MDLKVAFSRHSNLRTGGFGSILLGIITITSLVLVPGSLQTISAKEQIWVASSHCIPTAEDVLGPFYQPDAPIRSSVGKGYTLSGTVLSAADCSPVTGARIELWLAGPNGNYDDAHRATLYPDEKGRYSFESNFPPPYSSRPPHIHVRVTASGYKTLVTQHYPKQGETNAKFDLVLVSE
jgi:protocatechuate 3,4-dioxygenase beta subunit